ncbi:MAG: M14 family metallopeptidase [Bacillota bacterium]
MKPRREISSPEQHLGFPVGSDRRLANWEQIAGYFTLLAEQADCLQLEELGKSTEGRPFLLATISSPENLARLDHYRAIQARLADPRGLSEQEAAELIAEGKTICLITCSIHASEVGAAQMSMELAYDLVTRNDRETAEILDNVIFLLVPSLNPDGLDMVVDWYEQSLGTAYEGMMLPELYQKYTGHDNNRDWFMATQVETRLAIEKIHNVWHPHIVHDQHQQSSEGPRMVLPPFIDPYDENVDPILRGMVNWLGMSMASELTGRGFKGVATNLKYDAFSPSRAYQHYHGGVRILSEAASVRTASPVVISHKGEVGGFNPQVATWNHPHPWPGGDWRLRDIVDYDKACAWACLRHAARYRDSWVQNFYQIHLNAINYAQAPYAFIIPLAQDDPATAGEMLDVLMFGGVEVHRAKESFVYDDVTYPAGTLLIHLNQPYGRFAKTLLEAQPYPDLRLYPGGPPRRPYDITAHCLPMQMGVKVVAANQPLSVKGELVPQAPLAVAPPAAFQAKSAKSALLIDARSNQSHRLVHALLTDGIRVARTSQSVGEYASGSFLVSGDSAKLLQIADECSKYAIPHQDACPHTPARQLRQLPRVGLYKSYVPNADEGWTRFIYEGLGIPYRTVTNPDLRQGDVLRELDCLVLPSTRPQAMSHGLPGVYPPPYAGGIGQTGAEQIARFVNRGGTLVVLDNASEWVIQQLGLPVKNVLAGLPSERFYVPGSFLRVLLDTEHPVNYGLPREATVLFQHSPAFQLGHGASSLGDYPLHNPLVAGWILGDEQLHGRSALVEIPLGKGRVILVGFRPQFRAQSRGTYRTLFNAQLYSVLD